MIEVNLSPGGKKRAGRRRDFSLSMPKIGGLPSDPWVLGSGGLVAALLIVGVFLFLSVGGRYSEVEAAVEEAAADSALYADLIEQAETLQARRDSVADRVTVIQDIDQGRYVWPHILDEVARSLPDYTWMTSVVQTSSGEEVEFQIQGRVGNNFALTTFMESLESSPFIRGVTLVNTELIVESGGGVSRNVYSFILEATYEDPPLELLETVPLFGSGSPVLGDRISSGIGAPRPVSATSGPPASEGSDQEVSD